MEYREKIITMLSDILEQQKMYEDTFDKFALIEIRGYVIGIRNVIFNLYQDDALLQLCDSIITIITRSIKRIEEI